MATQSKAKANNPKANIIIKLLSGAELSKAIESIARRGKKLQAEIHQAAVSAINQAIEHGNATPARALMAAMPDCARKGALNNWMLEFGPFKIEPGSRHDYIIHSEKRAELLKDKTAHINAAMQMEFWKFTPDTDDTKTVSAMQEVQKLLNRLEKFAASGRLSPEDSTVVERLRAVVPAHIQTAKDAAPADAEPALL